MMITFDEEEICKIIAYYANRELDHDISGDEVVIKTSGRSSGASVTASYEVEQFPEPEDE